MKLPLQRSARQRVAIAVLAVLLFASIATAAGARSYKPAHGKLFHGVSDTGKVADFGTFRRQVADHPAVLQDFYHWGVPLTTGALDRWRATRTRGVLSLSSAPGGRKEVISPRAIAKGRGDHYILRLRESISHSRQVVYIRLFAEMNGHWNPYSAFNANGSRRGGTHSTKWFKRAWKRFSLIVHGGKRRRINRRLRHLHLPRILRAHSEQAGVYRRRHVRSMLPKPRVALIWNPQTFGSPNVRGNQPKDYWPGKRFVDWVGADIYSKYASGTVWRALNRFYHRYRKLPFAIGEYGAWDDGSSAFVRRLFGWAHHHKRTGMLVYYRSVDPSNIFNLQFYPAARSALRGLLNNKRVIDYAPEYRRKRR